MTKLARAVVVAALPLTFLVGCTATPDAEPTPTFSFNPAVPSASSAALPAGDEIRAWADIALPENRAGGPAAVSRTIGPLDPSAGAVIDIEQSDALWDVLITCQSADVSPISWRIDSPTSPADWTSLDCSGPGGTGTPTTSIITYEGPAAKLNLTSTAEAVFAVEVRPHEQPLD